MRKVVLALALLPANISAEEVKEAFLLQCDGTAPITRSANTFSNNREGQWQSGTASIKGDRAPVTAFVEINADIQRLDMPKPPGCAICKGERGGWREIKKLSVTESTISGRVSYGIFTTTQFEIDRRTGNMSAANGFVGMCRVLEERRKF